MLASAALVGDGIIGGGPYTRILGREFENEGIVCAFVGARRPFWRREDLHSRSFATPPARYALRVEANVSADPQRAFHNRPFDFCANPVPFLAVKSWPRFDSVDLCAFIGGRHPTLLAGERQVDYVLVTVVLTGAADSLLK